MDDSLVVMLLVPRLLGAENFGSFGFATAYVGFFTLAAGLGTSTLIPREVARDYSIVPSLRLQRVVLKVVLATVLVALALLGGVVFNFTTRRCARRDRVRRDYPHLVNEV